MPKQLALSKPVRVEMILKFADDRRFTFVASRQTLLYLFLQCLVERTNFTLNRPSLELFISNIPDFGTHVTRLAEYFYEIQVIIRHT